MSDATTSELPPLADWRAGVAGLSKADRQAAVRALLPLLLDLDQAALDPWIDAIVGMGAYKPAGLTGLFTTARKQRAAAAAGSKASGGRQSDDVDQADGEQPAAAPAAKPRPGAFQVPGSRWRYTPGEGVWDDKGWKLLDWCPQVTENLITYRDDGRVMGRSVTFGVGEHVTTAEIGDVEGGRAWDAMPGAAGASDRKVRDALANIISDQARRLPEVVAHPRWVGDRLVLPPADCLPQGYLEQGGTFDGWCELMRRSLDTPKIALVICLAVAGIYVKPCRRKSYVVHMKGVSSRGKTTTMLMSAGVFGNPEEGQVVENWNSTQNGVPAWLRGLRVLPGFRDEIQSAGFTPAQTQDLMFRVTGGGSRGASTRTGGYRKPPATWNSAFISTGNVSIVGRTDNTAMFARVIEVDTPFTDNAEQAEAFEDMALTHYGWGLPAIIEQGITPAEWSEWCAKALVALGNPSGDVLRRAGKHLAGAVAAAKLLGKITGTDRFEPVVLDAGKAALESIAADLGFKGTNSPAQQFLFALADAMAQFPDSFPSRTAYEMTVQSENRSAEVLGWDLADDVSETGDVALIPAGFRKVCRDYDITDNLIVLKELDRAQQLHRNRTGRDLTKQVWVAGKKRRAYVIDGLAELLDDEAAGRGPEGSPTDNPAPAPTDTSTDTSTDTKTGPEQGTTDSTDKIQGQCLGMREDTPDEDLLALLAAGTASDAELDAAAAELERRERAAQVPAPAPNPPSRTEDTRGGGSTRQRTTQRPKRAGVSRVAANAQVTGPSEQSAAHWAAWLADDGVRARLDTAGVTRDAELAVGGSEILAARVALGWHRVTDGLTWEASPGWTGRGLLRRLENTHWNVREKTPLTHPLALEITTGENTITRTDFVNTETVFSEGESITSADVRKQFLAAAGNALIGLGEPEERHIRHYDGTVKQCGYLWLDTDIEIDHPAYAGRTFTAGTVFAMPLVKHLHEWGITLPASRALVWPEATTLFKKHAGRIREWLARFAAIAADPDRPALDRAAAAVLGVACKDVYAVTYGGMLRSVRFAGDFYAPDANDQITAVAYANALRGLDMAAYGIAEVDPATGKKIGRHRDAMTAREAGKPMVADYAAGMMRDTAYFVHAVDVPQLPAALNTADQIGKWKQDKHVTITDDIVRAAERRSPDLLRRAVNAAWKENHA